jgi:hypothetical protein
MRVWRVGIAGDRWNSITKTIDPRSASTERQVIEQWQIAPEKNCHCSMFNCHFLKKRG